MKQLCQKASATHGIPYSSPQFATEHNGATFHLTHHRFQRIIALLDAVELPVSHIFHTQE